MSSVVDGNLVEVRVSLAVIRHNLSGAGFGRACAPSATIERVARIALERGRQPGAEQAGAGHGPLPESTTHLVGRLDGAPPTWLCRREQRELFAFA